MAFLRNLVRSAGFRFALLYTLAFVLSVAAIGWVVEAAVADALRSQALGHVDGEAGALVDEFVHGGRVDLDAALDGRFSRGEGRHRYAIVETDGRIAVGDPRLAAFRTVAGASARPFHDADGDPVVVAGRALGDGTTLLVADDLRSIQDVGAVLHRAFAIALIAAAVLGLAIGLFMSGVLLRRVDAVTRTAEAIIAGDLGRRIATMGSGDDLDRLARTLNRMLDRIAGLMENLRQVSNDIAHDLRTPLTRLRQGLQGASEGGVRGSGTDGIPREAVDRALVEIDEILDIFSALLRIAQIEAGARRAAFRPLDLSAVLGTVAEAYTPAIEDGGRRLACAIAPGIRVNGDRELLTQLFSNLFENALQHTPPGAAIRVALERVGDVQAGGVAQASVADDGPGIPADERGKVFRRFYRVEKSRGSAGHGLGLTLVAAVAELHEGRVAIADAAPGAEAPGLRVTVALAALPAAG